MSLVWLDREYIYIYIYIILFCITKIYKDTFLLRYHVNMRNSWCYLKLTGQIKSFAIFWYMTEAVEAMEDSRCSWLHHGSCCADMCIASPLACNLKAAEMNVQCSLIWELTLYQFKRSHNAAKVTKNIYAKGEGVVDYITVNRWLKKVYFGCKKLHKQVSRDGSRRRGGGNDTLPPLN